MRGRLTSIDRIFPRVQESCEAAELGFYPNYWVDGKTTARERLSYRIARVLVWECPMHDQAPGINPWEDLRP